MFLNIVPKKLESTDDEEKIGNEESDLEEACILPPSPINVDKRPITIKSPKVKYFLWFWDSLNRNAVVHSKGIHKYCPLVESMVWVIESG